MKNKKYNLYILTCFYFSLLILIPSYGYCSSDEGLQINLNKFHLQVRMDMEGFSKNYYENKLYIDFYNIIAFCKENYLYLSTIDKNIIFWMQYEEDNDEPNRIILHQKNNKTKEIQIKDHLTLCSLLAGELNLPFSKVIDGIELGYKLVYYSMLLGDNGDDYSNYKKIIGEIPKTEIEIGAMPGTYETKVNGKRALVFAYFNKLPGKKYYKNDNIYQEEKTIMLTKDNFNKYLSGSLGVD